MSRYRPSLEEFTRLVGSAPCIPVSRQLTGDGLTPVSAFRLIDRGRFSFLFESVVGGEKVGRYSFLGTEPFLRFRSAWPGCGHLWRPTTASLPAPISLGRSIQRARAARRALPHRSVQRAAPLRRWGGRIRLI